MIIPALSLTQPYATLIAIGDKRLETRRWHPQHRGLLAIHAARTFPPIARALCAREPFSAALRAAGMPLDWTRDGTIPTPLPLGAIVALGCLVECVRTADLAHLPDSERAFGDYSAGRWAWRLDAIYPLTEPIHVRGHLGLWPWDCPKGCSRRVG